MTVRTPTQDEPQSFVAASVVKPGVDGASFDGSAAIDRGQVGRSPILVESRTTNRLWVNEGEEPS